MPDAKTMGRWGRRKWGPLVVKQIHERIVQIGAATIGWRKAGGNARSTPRWSRTNIHYPTDQQPVGRRGVRVADPHDE